MKQTEMRKKCLFIFKFMKIGSLMGFYDGKIPETNEFLPFSISSAVVRPRGDKAQAAIHCSSRKHLQPWHRPSKLFEQAHVSTNESARKRASAPHILSFNPGIAVLKDMVDHPKGTSFSHQASHAGAEADMILWLVKARSSLCLWIW